MISIMRRPVSRCIAFAIALASFTVAARGSAADARAADQDRVVLKDGGTVIVGTIVSVDDAAVVIRTASGRELRFNMRDVESVKQRQYKPSKAAVAVDDGSDSSDVGGGDAAAAATGAGTGAAAGEAKPQAGDDAQAQDENGDDEKPKKKKKKKTKVGVGAGGVEVGGTLEESEAKRQDWAKRGGSLVGFDLYLNATYSYFKPSSSSSGLGGSCSLEQTGYGGGASLRVNYIYLSPPKPNESNTLFMFKLGTGGEFDALGTTMKLSGCGFADGSTSSGNGVVTVPFTAGLALGLGGFGDKGKWSGVVIGAGYSPSMVYSFPFSNSSSSGGGSGGGSSSSPSFNPVGFELTLDFTSLEAVVDKAAQEAHFRLLFFGLPPTDKTPLLLSLGFGIVWY